MVTKSAYRLETHRVKEPDFPYDNQKFSSAEDVVNFVKVLENADVEKMIILYLNQKHKLVCLQTFPGTVNAAYVWPREVAKMALMSGSPTIILVHNHPSGVPEPSNEDIALTQRIKDACQLIDTKVLDHVIIGEAGKYTSFTEQRIL